MATVHGGIAGAPREKSWAGEHWILSALIVFVILVAIGIGFIGAIFSMLSHSDAARLAITRAEASPVVTETTGVPLKMGWMITGSVNVRNSGGNAELAFPVEGPRGKGTLHTTAIRKDSQWHLVTLEFTRDGSDTAVNLLGDSEQKK